MWQTATAAVALSLAVLAQAATLPVSSERNIPKPKEFMLKYPSLTATILGKLERRFSFGSGESGVARVTGIPCKKGLCTGGDRMAGGASGHS